MERRACEEVLALLAGGGEERGQDGGDLGAELGAEAAGDLAMDDGGAEVLLGGVVGGRDVRAVEEDEQAGAVLAVALLEAAGVGGVGLSRAGRCGRRGGRRRSRCGVGVG